MLQNTKSELLKKEKENKELEEELQKIKLDTMGSQLEAEAKLNAQVQSLKEDHKKAQEASEHKHRAALNDMEASLKKELEEGVASEREQGAQQLKLGLENAEREAAARITSLEKKFAAEQEMAEKASALAAELAKQAAAEAQDAAVEAVRLEEKANADQQKAAMQKEMESATDKMKTAHEAAMSKLESTFDARVAEALEGAKMETVLKVSDAVDDCKREYEAKLADAQAQAEVDLTQLKKDTLSNLESEKGARAEAEAQLGEAIRIKDEVQVEAANQVADAKQELERFISSSDSEQVIRELTACKEDIKLKDSMIGQMRKDLKQKSDSLESLNQAVGQLQSRTNAAELKARDAEAALSQARRMATMVSAGSSPDMQLQKRLNDLQHENASLLQKLQSATAGTAPVPAVAVHVSGSGRVWELEKQLENAQSKILLLEAKITTQKREFINLQFSDVSRGRRGH